jgi:5-methyltetrahydrofolate--homocysteine methyltransferase
VKEDVHDIGKTLVAVMLQAAGHEVVDLGVDVSADRFVEAVKTYRPHVLGLSALLTTTTSYIRVVIEELERAGLRDSVFIVVGGAATTPEFAKQIGADAWVSNALEAVKLLNQVADKLVSRGEARDPR